MRWTCKRTIGHRSAMLSWDRPNTKSRNKACQTLIEAERMIDMEAAAQIRNSASSKKLRSRVAAQGNPRQDIKVCTRPRTPVQHQRAHQAYSPSPVANSPRRNLTPAIQDSRNIQSRAQRKIVASAIPISIMTASTGHIRWILRTIIPITKASPGSLLKVAGRRQW